METGIKISFTSLIISLVSLIATAVMFIWDIMDHDLLGKIAATAVLFAILSFICLLSFGRDFKEEL